MFRVGVIGATGYIGEPYRRELRACEGVEIRSLCARRRPLLEAAGREDGATQLTCNWQEVVENPDLNLVLVLTPDALHHPIVMACAEQGKHLLCEKPIGLDVGQAREMRDAYAANGLGHFVPFWTRYVPIVVRARQLVQEGQLGEVRGVVYRWHNPRPPAMPFTWRDDASVSSAGSIADVGSHAYDTLRWMLGEEVVRVQAHAAVVTDAKPDFGEINLSEALRRGEAGGAAGDVPARRGTAYDYASISFEFAGGAVGCLILSHASFLRKGLAPEIEVHGTEASLAVDRAGGALTLVQDGGGLHRRVEVVRDGEAVNRFAEHVLPALRRGAEGGASGHPNLEDGYQVQRFTAAAARSAREGGWVST